MSTSNHANVEVASGDSLDVRSFAVRQGMSELFHIDVRVMSKNLDVDFDTVIGQPAKFTLGTHWSAQTWEGTCSEMEQIRVDSQGLATYALVIQPKAWLMTQRRNYRIFQFETELDIVKKMLGEWGVKFEERVDPGNYKPRKYRCQYAETDFDFISRWLEHFGIFYCFEQTDDGDKLVFLDSNRQTVAVPGYEEVVRGEAYLDRVSRGLATWASSWRAITPPASTRSSGSPR